jgi:large subunit ribosomal protein L16
MFLQPKKTKYKKTKKGKLNKLEYKTNKLKFGTIGLKAVNSAIITARQIEASRQAISRKIKKKGKLWIRAFPDVPITSKSVAARMGKGKGAISHWGARIRGGSIIFEICGVKDFNVIKNALRTGGAKLPLKTKIIRE